MGLPSAVVKLSNGNLGRLAPSEDGTSGLIVSGIAVVGQFALGDVIGPFTSLADAEAKGITSAYDTANNTIAWRHIKDFYDYAGDGTELYVMVVAQTVTLAQQVDKTNNYLKKLLSTTLGNIKIWGCTFTPDGTYVPAYTGQFETDLATAITNAKALIAEEFDLFRPTRGILEARNFQGSMSTATDLRASAGPNANGVMIFAGQDWDYGQTVAYRNKYAAVGIALGKAARIAVQRNLGRVKDGPLLITTAGLSNGQKLSTFSESNQGAFNDRGYVFFRQHTGKAGYFFNDDHTAAPITDDYSQFSLGRTMDKAARITRSVYVEEILDDIEIDPTTGKLDPSTIKHYQGIVEKEIRANMVGNIDDVSAFCDPNQNVLSTSQIKIKIKIVPKGTIRNIEAELGYSSTI